VAGLGQGIVLYARSQAEVFLAEGFPQAKVFVSQNAIDREPIEKALGAPREDERLKTIPAEDKVIVFSSRLEPDKKPGLLLEALTLVRKSLPARLIFLGDGPLLELLKQEAKRLGLEPHVEFLGAEYDETKIAPIMRRAHVFAYPAAIGLSLLHAFHYGLPVITSDDYSSHNPEIEALIPGENGEVFVDGSAEDFARVLVSVLEDEPHRIRLSRGALETVTRPGGYTLNQMVEGMQRAIQTVYRAPRSK